MQFSSVSNNYIILITPKLKFFRKENNKNIFELNRFLGYNKTFIIIDCRLKMFLTQFLKNGKFLKIKLIYMCLIRLLRFKLKCNNPIFLINFVLRMLEPFFEVRNTKVYRKSTTIVLINSIKRRIFFSTKFFADAVYEKSKRLGRSNNKSLVFLIFDELLSIIKRSKTSIALKKYKLYNQSIRKSRFFVNKNLKYAYQFPKKFI